MWSSAYTPRVDNVVYDAWETGYVHVNQEFADAVVETTRDLAFAVLAVGDEGLDEGPGRVDMGAVGRAVQGVVARQ